MQIVYNRDHFHHQSSGELNDGEIQPANEKPVRFDNIKSSLEAHEFGHVVECRDYGMEPLFAVHAVHYVEFLHDFWAEWQQERGDIDALPLIWPTRGFNNSRPAHLDGRLSYYSFDAGTPIMAGTWKAAYGSAQTALTAADEVYNSSGAAFALCRPPGHHAMKDALGGYCFLNNVAVAAQSLLDKGAMRVAVIDVDYHHGNGTQSIFYDRDDVLVINLHADPKWEFPYFLGARDETGAGAGEGFNLNFPMPLGTAWDVYGQNLDQALAALDDYQPDVLLVSLGVDTWQNDPISSFKLNLENFYEIGRRLGDLERPTVFVMEGGYDIDAIGANVHAVLSGFENG